MSSDQTEKPTDGLTAEKLAKALKVNIARALNEGKTAGVAKDIRELRQLEKEMAVDRGLELTEQHDPDEGIPERLKVKRSYKLTPEAITARRENARLSTGPVSEAGKQRSRRNAYKHGSYAATRILGLGKPCKSTCSHYPCNLVEEGRCVPGSDCLDKEHLVEACIAIEDALLRQDQSSLNELVVFELAETLQVIRDLRRAILDDGTVIKSEKFDADGKVIGFELKAHPALLALPKLMKDFGLSLTDFMVTPAALEKKRTDAQAVETLADIFRGAGDSLAKARAKTGNGSG